MTGLALAGLVLAGLAVATLVVVFLGPVLAERLRAPMDNRLRALAPGQFADLAGGQTHWQWHGPSRGPVVVCIHGLTTSSYVWDPVIAALTVLGYRVLTYDLYGRGMSDRPRGPQDRAFFQRQLLGVLEAAGAEDRLTLISYSMGGMIATAFATDHPGRVVRLILLAPAGLGMTEDGFTRFARRVPVLGDAVMLLWGGVRLRAAIDRSLPVSAERPDIARRQAEETRVQGYLAAVLSSRRHLLASGQEADHARLAAMRMPVLAIWGEADAVIPLAAMGRLARMNRNARQVMLPGATHALPYTHPREVVAAMLDELRTG